MNTRPTRPGGKPLGGKPLGGKPLGGKPVSSKPLGGEPVSSKPLGGRLVSSEPPGGRQQEKSKPSKTIAETAGALKREDTVLAAASASEAAQASKPAPHLLAGAFESIERSLKAAGQGTVAVNRKLIDIARTNVSSGFDLALAVAAAKNPLEVARLQMAFFDQHMKALAAQAHELRALQAELVMRASEPIREHVKRS